MTQKIEELTDSINAAVDSAVEEVNTPAVHPAVGVVGVGAIGAFLGALVGGPVGAIVGASIGALGASVENTKSGKSGFFSNRDSADKQSLSSRFQTGLDRERDTSVRTAETTKARKKLAQDRSTLLAEPQQETYDIADSTQPIAEVEDVSDSGSDQATINRPLKGILLDIDGTLVLSNDAHAQAWVEAFAAFGYTIQFEQVRPLIGMGGDQVVPRLIPELSAEEGVGKQVADRRKELIIHQFGSNLSPAPGSRDLVLRLQQEGLQLIVASSATSEELSVLLESAQVKDLLREEPATTSSDAENSKPAPDLVQSALSKGQLQPNQVIMLGDTPYDIQAADAAGVKMIAFRCGGFDDSQLAGALAIYNDPADLLTHYEQSPLAQGATQISSSTTSDSLP